MKIAIATASELKIRALKDALALLKIDAEILSAHTESGIPEQPIGFEQTSLGAKNRLMQCKKNFDADISVAVESGVVKILENNFDIACVHVVTRDGRESIAYSSGYFVPEWMLNEAHKNDSDIGVVTKRVSGGEEKDPLGYFSDNTINREHSLSQAIVLALVKLFNEDKYKIK